MIIPETKERGIFRRSKGRANATERSPQDLEITSISFGDGKGVILELSARTVRRVPGPGPSELKEGCLQQMHAHLSL